MAIATVDSKDGISFTGHATGQTAPVFLLLGGKYMFGMTAADTSSALQIQLPDGSFIAVGSTTNFTTSAATVGIDLTRGTYKIVCVSATLVAGFIQKIPYNDRG